MWKGSESMGMRAMLKCSLFAVPVALAAVLAVAAFGAADTGVLAKDCDEDKDTCGVLAKDCDEDKDTCGMLARDCDEDKDTCGMLPNSLTRLV